MFPHLQRRTLYLVLLSMSTFVARAQSTTKTAVPKAIQTHDLWTDSSTNLTWAARDNGKDVSWKGALKFCRTLRLGGYTDWRLANMFELQGIYEPSATAPGRAGDTKGGVPASFTWHVKGDLFLTGDEWSSRGDGKEKSSGYGYYFDFNEGKSNNNPVGWPYPYNGMRALCVRGSGDPLGGQRQRARSIPPVHE
jgi:hypothetical protein